MEAPRGVELTGTNRPRTYHTTHTSCVELFCVHCAVLNPRPATLVARQVHSVTAAMARGKRPATFRTRKLSLSAPMVLPRGRGGRVGRRRTTIPEGAPHRPGAGPLLRPRQPEARLPPPTAPGWRFVHEPAGGSSTNRTAVRPRTAAGGGPVGTGSPLPPGGSSTKRAAVRPRTAPGRGPFGTESPSGRGCVQGADAPSGSRSRGSAVRGGVLRSAILPG